MVNPADHVKLPSERKVAGGAPGAADDPDMFLTATQVAALVDATPWPCNVMVHTAVERLACRRAGWATGW
jgi:hypothetical protein